MQTTVLKEIIAFILGRKYYANIINMKGTTDGELCSFIFTSKEDADKHKETIMDSLSFRFIETISFRSRKNYTRVKTYNNG